MRRGNVGEGWRRGGGAGEADGWSLRKWNRKWRKSDVLEFESKGNLRAETVLASCGVS